MSVHLVKLNSNNFLGKRNLEGLKKLRQVKIRTFISIVLDNFVLWRNDFLDNNFLIEVTGLNRNVNINVTVLVVDNTGG